MPGAAPKLVAWPNPFSDRVHFSTGGRGESVGVLIYDLSGRLVAELRADGNMSWNGLDAEGRAVPAGVYLYRASDLEAGGPGKLLFMR